MVDTLRERLAGATRWWRRSSGGGEKLRGGQAAGLDELYGLPVTACRWLRPAGARRGRPAAACCEGAARARCARRWRPARGWSLTCRDEPVLGYQERFQLISVALSWGARYVGADTEFCTRSRSHDSAAKPSLAIIGTGKRVGKTAVSGCSAAGSAPPGGLDAGGDRGAWAAAGPAAPQVVYGGDGLGAHGLLAVSRQAGTPRPTSSKTPC